MSSGRWPAEQIVATRSGFPDSIHPWLQGLKAVKPQLILVVMVVVPGIVDKLKKEGIGLEVEVESREGQEEGQAPLKVALMRDVPWFDVREEGDNMEHDRGGHVDEINGGSKGTTVAVREGNVSKRCVWRGHGSHRR